MFPLYWTIKIGWQKWNATKWHPTEETGPFTVLVRGTFSTPEKAKAWAERELGAGGNWIVFEVPADEFMSEAP